MSRPWTFVLAFAAAITAMPAALTRAAAGQSSPAQSGRNTPALLFRSVAEVVARPVPLRSGIGVAHETVTTRVLRAQQFCDQGLAYLHSYSWLEAARSFNEALRADTSVALAQVGLSYALGELGDTTGARLASRRASDAAATATPRERFRIELRARQLAAADAPTSAGAARAYRSQLARITTELPTDIELLLIAGHAQDPDDSHGMSGGNASLPFYERARALAPDYFAVQHYLAHTYENLGDAAAALPFAQRFAAAAPAIPHAHHMYGHVLRQVDRMGDAIAEFETADRLHREFATTERLSLDLDWHYRHNLDLLATSYQYVGQFKKAERLLKESFGMQAAGLLGHDQDVNKRAWPLFLLARQRPEALAAARQMQAHPSPLVQALGHILASRALVATGNLTAAADEGNAALTSMRTMGPRGGVLRPDFEVAQGEFRLRSGDATGGAMLKAGVSKMAAERGPDAWVATVIQLEMAVRVAREHQQAALAEELAALLRQQAPYYAGTHFALAQLAEGRGDLLAATAHFTEALTRWRDADPDLPELAEARRRLTALTAVAARSPRPALPPVRPRPARPPVR